MCDNLRKIIPAVKTLLDIIGTRDNMAMELDD